MSTIAPPIKPRSATGVPILHVVVPSMTAEEFAAWVQLPANADRYFELERGKVIEMPPPIPWHGFITARITRILGQHAETSGVGLVLSNDSGVIVERNPDSVRGPDVSYFTKSFANETEMKLFLRSYLSVPPVIAVEVLSPSDRVNRIAAKVDEYLAFGVKQVWVVDPESKDVAVHRPGKSMLLLEGDAELPGGNDPPGFSCRVSDFLRMPGQKVT